MKLEISIDDGHYKDMKALRLLDKYNLKGIFFIPTGRTSLSVADLREIASRHEIGAHTITHPSDMKLLDLAQIQNELVEPKRVLEDIIGKPVTKFCYPRGRYNEIVKEEVKKAGYEYARTTKIGNLRLPKDMFEIDSTVHIFPRKEYDGEPFLDYALCKIEEAQQFDDGYYHLWFHSWEVDDNGYWDELETILSHLEGLQ